MTTFCGLMRWAGMRTTQLILAWLALAAIGLLPAAAAAPWPPEVQARLAELSRAARPGVALVEELVLERRRIAQLPDPEARREANRLLVREHVRAAQEAQERRLLRAANAPDFLDEQLLWFWFNHFNVFVQRQPVGLLVADYEDKAIRPHIRGRFCDMLRAVTFHPAMLFYLDNVQNAAGRINENFARELLELHTLGVDGGYTQADVQELARILTGLGLPEPGSGRTSVVDPKRHDLGEKVLLGQRIPPGGEDEVDAALQLLCRHPATARRVARKLAQYFEADEPSQALVHEVAAAFERSGGHLGQATQALLGSPHRQKAGPGRFLEPYRYVLHAVRMLRGDRPVTNVAPIVRWLSELGQPVYGRRTPDGYPMHTRDWASPGQMAARFEVAREMSVAFPRLFPSGLPPHVPDVLSHAAAILDPHLRPGTRQALSAAGSPEQALAVLLSSPEVMRWR